MKYSVRKQAYNRFHSLSSFKKKKKRKHKNAVVLKVNIGGVS